MLLAWVRGVALCLLACVCLPPGQAVGQDGAATPSADELWEHYPLAATPEAATATPEAAKATQKAAKATPEAATATPSRGASVRLAATTAEKDGGWATTDVVLLMLVTAIGGTTAVWLERRRRSPRPAATGPARPARALPGAPPDPAAAWRAEIGWREADGMARFQVTAQRVDGRDATVVAESPAFEWPPSTDGSVQALTAAADRLEASLLDAGWSRLAPGSAWYARRFGWEPVAARGAPPRPAARPAPTRNGDHESDIRRRTRRHREEGA